MSRSSNNARTHANGCSTKSGDRRRHHWMMVFGMLISLIWSMTFSPQQAGAHAALKASDPSTNAIVAAAPTAITLEFTEPLERSYSRAEMFDQTGTLVPDAISVAGDDQFTMVIDVPVRLPNGTYSVLWRSLSTADGHTAQGYYAFTVGSEADVQSFVPPAATEVTGGPSEGLQTVSRWLALLGLASLVAVWPTWLFVVRPAISPVWQLGPRLTRHMHRVAILSLGLAIAGSVLALIVQAMGVGAATGFVSGLTTTLGETRYGSLWLLRIGLFVLYAAVLIGAAWWRPWRRRGVTMLALGFAAVLPLPFSLISHAAAQLTGRETAIAFDALHTLAASIWAGGLFILVASLGPTIRALTPAGRRVVLGRVLARFSLIALAAWIILVATGFYSAWLEVGSLDALRQTPYGQSLMVKLLLLLPLLALGAFNQLIVQRRLRQATDERSATGWSNRFAVAIVSEAILVVLVFLVVGRLTAQPPARDVLAQNAGRLAVSFDADGQQATLYVTPGVAGPNHYRLELGSGHNHSPGRGAAPVEAVLRVQLPSRDTGQKQIDLVQASGGAFEAHGSELGIAGDWTVEALVRQAGQADWRASAIQRIDVVGPETSLPGPPPRFGPAGVVGLLLCAAGIVGLILAWQVGRSPLRKEVAGLSSVALVLGIILLLQAQYASGAELEGYDQVAIAPPDPGAVERGAPLYAANCMTCHGVGGRGDGPSAAGLNPAPTDLTVPHARIHRDEDIAYWIETGIPGSAMPRLGDQLSEAEIRDLVAYVRAIQLGSTATPIP